MKLRSLLPLLALLAPFALPWYWGVVLAVIGSYVFPLTAFLAGALYDALYAPSGLHYGLLLGTLISACMFGVRAFIKKRIIG